MPMPASQITCPKCAATLAIATPLPAGNAVKCTKCAAVFQVKAKQTTLAVPARPTVIASGQAKPTKLAGTAPTGPAVVCSKCSVKLRLPRPVPPGTAIRCPKCAGIIRVPPPAPPRPKTTTLAGSQSPPARPPRTTKKTVLAGGPPPAAKPPTVAHIICPACKVALKLKGAPPVGQPIRCPACKKQFSIRPKQPAAPGPAKPQQPAAGPLPGAAVRQGRMKDGKIIRQTDCPSCRAVLRTTSPLPVGKAIKCPKCARPFRLFGPKAQPGPQQAKPTQEATKVKAPAAAQPSTAVKARPQAALRGVPWRTLTAITVIGLLLGIWIGLRWYLPADIPEHEWETFTLKDDRCQISMPGSPESVPVMPGRGASETKKFSVGRMNDRGMFGPLLGRVEAGFSLAVSLNEPTATFEQLYAAERDSVVRRVNGTLLSEEPITLNGIPGREFQVKFANGMVIARFYRLQAQPNSRSYLVVAGGTHLRPGAGDAARFLDSFKIEPAK